MSYSADNPVKREGVALGAGLFYEKEIVA